MIINNLHSSYIKLSENNSFLYLDEVARCRWSTNPSENLLYLKYDLKQLNILDSEKKTLIFGSPILLERESKSLLPLLRLTK